MSKSDIRVLIHHEYSLDQKPMQTFQNNVEFYKKNVEF